MTKIRSAYSDSISDPGVAHEKQPTLLLLPGTYVDMRRFFAVEFQGIGDQILKQL